MWLICVHSIKYHGGIIRKLCMWLCMSGLFPTGYVLQRSRHHPTKEIRVGNRRAIILPSVTTNAQEFHLVHLDVWPFCQVIVFWNKFAHQLDRNLNPWVPCIGQKATHSVTGSVTHSDNSGPVSARRQPGWTSRAYGLRSPWANWTGVSPCGCRLSFHVQNTVQLHWWPKGRVGIAGIKPLKNSNRGNGGHWHFWKENRVKNGCPFEMVPHVSCGPATWENLWEVSPGEEPCGDPYMDAANIVRDVDLNLLNSQDAGSKRGFAQHSILCSWIL